MGVVRLLILLQTAQPSRLIQDAPQAMTVIGAKQVACVWLTAELR